MSSTDERIVSMKFENAAFEAGAAKALGVLGKLSDALKFDGATSSLQNVKSAISSFSMDSVSSTLSNCQGAFAAFGDYASGVFFNLSNRVQNFATDIARKVTIEPMMDGLREYETQIGSVQTILSNSGDKLKAAGLTTQEEQIDKINASLDELNTYADKTIYNFSEMTRNIGTFTAAGVDLDTATTSIQGIANLAAASGSSSQQASTAMYQLSQAIAAGSLKLQDWNSVVNAGMGGELFQNALKRTARAHGVAVDDMIEKNGSFRESLQEGWITSDILTETLQQLTMTTEDLTDAEVEEMKQSLINQGYTKEDAEAILDLANNAQQAATKVRTWTQLWDTVGEALGSGWASSWRIIVGDFLEATDLFTHLSDGITGIIGASADARNAVLQQWSESGGRTALVDGIKYTFDAIVSIVSTIGEAFSDVFGISAKELFNITAAFGTFAEKLVPSKEAVQFLYDALFNVFTVIHSVIGIIGNAVRIVFSFASVIWKLIAPFVKLAGVIGGVILKGFAIFSEVILKITDYIQGFVDIVAGGLGTAINFVYGALGGVIGFFASIGKSLDVLKKHVSEIALGFLDFAKTLPGISSALSAFSWIQEKVTSGLQNFENLFFGKKEHAEYAPIEDLSPWQKFEIRVEAAQDSLKRFVKGFLETDDKVGYVSNALSQAFSKLRDKFLGFVNAFKNPRNFLDALLDMRHAMYNFIRDVFGFGDVGDRINKLFFAIANPFYRALSSILRESDTWSQALGKPFKSVVDIFNKLKKTFSNLIKYFKNLFSSGKSIPEMIATVFFDVVDKVKEWGSKLPETLSNAKDAIKKKFEEFKVSFGEFKETFRDKIVEMFSNLPSLNDISGKISEFTGSVKTFFSDNFSGLFGDVQGPSLGDSGFFETIKASLSNVVQNISGLNIDLSGVSNMFTGFWDMVVKGLYWVADNIPTEQISAALDYAVEKIKAAIEKHPWAIVLAEVLNFVHSLSKMNRGIGGFGDKFAEGCGKIGEGLSNFGSGFTKFKKQTKSKAFQNVALGILALAGALWVVAQIPADRLADVTLTLGGFALGVAVLTASLGGISKIAKLDLESIGKSIAGFGLGILALAASIWIFSKIPADVADENLGRVRDLIAEIGLVLVGISAVGGNLQGAAAAIAAIGLAVILLMIPIEILGRTPDDVLVKGGAAVTGLMVVIAGCVSLMEFANKNGGSIMGAAPTILALAIAINLLMIPVAILGNMGDGLWTGIAAVGALSLLIGLTIGVIGLMARNSRAVLAATPAILALAIAINLLVIPIKILGTMPLPELVQGGVAVALLTIVLGGVVAAIGALASNVGGLLAGTVALVALTLCVTLLAGVVVALTFVASMNPGALAGAVVSVLALVGALAAGLAALSAFGIGAGVGLAAIAGGIVLFGLSLMVLAAGIMMLQSGPDWQGIANGISSVVQSIFEAGANIVQGLLDGIASLAGTIVDKAKELATNFIDGVKSFFGINSPSTVMADIGGNVVQGLIDGIGGLIGSLGEKAGEIFTAVTDKIKGLPKWFAEKASGAGDALANGIGGFAGKVAGKVGELGKGALDGLKNLSTGFGQKGGESGDKLNKNLSSKAPAVKQTSKTYYENAKSALVNLANEFGKIGKGGGDSLARGLSGGTGAVRSAASGLGTAARSGVGTVSLYSVGSSIVDGFVRGIKDNEYKGVNAAIAMAKNTKAGAAREAQVKSPSRVFMKIGGYIADGFAIGIRGGIKDAGKAGTELAAAVPEAFSDSLNSMSLGVEDILDTDYNPVISPVIDPTEFNYSLASLNSSLNSGLTDNLNIGNVNYSGEIVGKLNEFGDYNKQALQAFAENAIDYNQLGNAVAGALIASGVHVEIDGGKLMGYLAGEIQDARRMYK